MRNLFRVFLWYPLSFLVLVGGYLIYNSASSHDQHHSVVRQEIDLVSRDRPIFFAAIPFASLEIKSAIAADDARPIVIERYMRDYKSPMLPYIPQIIAAGDRYGVDPYLIVAIAQQESNLGKITPPACHNAWGWGIHSAGTLCFDNWEEGINTFTQGLAEKYLAYGLRTPDEIMTKYNATSPGGAWARGVNQFLSALQRGSW